MMRAKLVIAAILVLVKVAYADDTRQSRLAHFVDTGKELLNSERRISQGSLDKEADVDVMLNNEGFAWRSEQQKFHDQVVPLVDQYRTLSPAEQDSTNVLVRFSIFTANAMTAMTLCNKVEAAWEMDVASQMIDHVQRTLVSRNVSDWHIDLSKDPKTIGGCR